MLREALRRIASQRDLRALVDFPLFSFKVGPKTFMGVLCGAEVATLIIFIDGRLRLPEDLSVRPFARLKRYIEKLMVTSPALAPRIVTPTQMEIGK